jgi:hypothetical protein
LQSAGTTALTIATNQAITVASTGNGITYSSSGGSGLRVYGGAGTHQWDLYLNGANIRLGDNTGGGAFQLDSNLNFGSSNGGITFNNSSATVNSTLNDYEYGTFTVTDASGAGLTFQANTGYYTKVGRLVSMSFDITYPTTSSTAGAKITLPFTAITGGPSGAGAVGYSGYAGGVTAYAGATTYISFYTVSAGVGLKNVDLSAKEFAVNFIYQANF